jgi:hypothetical protein
MLGTIQKKPPFGAAFAIAQRNGLDLLSIALFRNPTEVRTFAPEPALAARCAAIGPTPRAAFLV